MTEAGSTRSLVEFLAQALAEEPESVEVSEVTEAAGETVLEVRVAQDDLGRLIGRSGRVANALRAVARAAATREQKRILVEIIED